MVTDAWDQKLGWRCSMDNQVKELKWGLRQRLTFIESCLLWNKKLTTNMLIETFEIGRRQAGKDIQAYQDIADENIIYDKYKRGYIPTDNFKPIFLTGTANEYLDWMQATTLEIAPLITLPSLAPTAEFLRIPQPQLNLQNIQAITEGIRNHKKVLIVNISNANVEYFISPHTLIYDGQGWYVRAFDSQCRDFIMIDLTTIKKADISDESSIMKYTGDMTEVQNRDHEWQHYVKINIVINPDIPLSNQERESIEQAYSLQDGILAVEIRIPLAEQFITLINNTIACSRIGLFLATIA